MEYQCGNSTDQAAAQVHVSRFGDALAFSFALSCARVIAATDQATAAKDLTGVLVVCWVTDRGCQACDLDGAKSFELAPDLIWGLFQQCA